ncbi:N-acetylglutamate synthase-like GNAT family acetyltransferase [Stella humosa]|uniref:N-acetylglutamate synthase-like GNAT family acetyltransferase n=1 Tax=Stella humosa TaxID=94 RepID=A0A3N1LPZ1_9PROT|nr:GNAT family N-acetyltransferase [Stella humosa]ROP91265.1 N-acetylglutamate synthase-like GNAT family acetyltransferase [Stella humosa]
MSLPDGYTDVPAGKLATVVTALEMLAPPAARPDPSPAPWTLRPAHRPDLDWYRDLYRRVGEDWLWFSRLRMADTALAAIIHDPGVAVFALAVDGRDEGLLELDFRAPGICELAFFGVTAGQLGSGAGRWLMNRAVEQAWSRPIGRLWVHTCTLDHPAALAFYIRSGFTPYQRQIEIADDPRLLGEAPRSAAAHIPML